MRHLRLATLLLLAMLAIALLSACGGGNEGDKAGANLPEASESQVIKPRPVVVSVTASTTGLFEDYYAILDITVKNGGADGMVIVVATITQGASTSKNELPVYIARNSIQPVRLVFPLKWRGGDWTPNVQTEIP